MVSDVTGWGTSIFELIKIGERCVNLNRLFNLQHGHVVEDEDLPARFFTPLTSGPLKGTAVNHGKFKRAKKTYYKMAGWNNNGVPTKVKLEELAIGWARTLAHEQKAPK